MERLMLKCPSCGGGYIVDDGENKCLTCSRVLTGNKELHAYYLYNKEAILSTVKGLGLQKATLKLNIPKTTLYGLIKRWSKNGTPAPAPATAKNTTLVLPPLPAWSDTWDPTVQLAWLEIYKYMVNGSVTKEVASVKDNKAGG